MVIYGSYTCCINIHIFLFNQSWNLIVLTDYKVQCILKNYKYIHGVFLHTCTVKLDYSEVLGIIGITSLYPLFLISITKS